MRYVIRALHAEALKMKRTLALWLALIAPAVVIALQVMVIWNRQDYYRGQELAREAWYEYGSQTMVLWGLLMLPLFITLETALVGQWEHRDHQWKHLFALPIPRGAIYAAKQIAGMALIGLSLLTLVALIVLTGLGMRFLLPGLGLETQVPLAEFLSYGLAMFLGSWLTVAIQTWVAQRWPSFAVASGIGIAMTVTGAVAIQSKWAGFYPYTLPLMVANGFGGESMQTLRGFTEGMPWKELLVGSLGGVLAALVGCWESTRRDVL